MDSRFDKHEFLALLVKALPFPILILDRTGNVLLQSERFFINRNLTTVDDFLRLVGPEDRVALLRYFKAGSPSTDSGPEVRLLGADGVYFWHSVSVVPLLEFVIVCFFDRDRSRRIEERRKLAIAGFSHDLRTPLTAAKLKAQAAARTSSDELIVDLARHISRDMDRADKLIRDMLDTGKWESGRSAHLRFTEFNAHAAIDEIIQEHALLYGDRFQFVSSVRELQVSWDRDGFRRILENLLSNAYKYGDRKRPIDVRLSESADAVSVAVHNSGRPIPKELLPALFNIYHQGNAEPSATSWGLGLAVVKELCEAHEGSVYVQSCGEEGTVFTVILPRVPSARSLPGEPVEG